MKILGIFLVFSVSVTLGVLKSLSLKERAQSLEAYQKGLHSLAERVRTDSRELSVLLPVCFEKRVFFRGNSIVFDTEYLTRDDIKLLDEFFSSLGRGEKLAEHERTRLFCRLLEDARKTAEAEYLKLGRLYRTIGVSAGVGLCIFLI